MHSMSISQRAAGLSEALEAMDQGFLWLDQDLVVQQHNQAYRRLLEIDVADAYIGRPYQELIRYLYLRGEFNDTAHLDTFLAGHLRQLQSGTARQFERVRPNGCILRVSVQPLPSGGYVYTYLDITRECHALETVRRNIKATVVAMANFAEHRDTDTGAHVLRVARLAGQTARELQRQGHYLHLIDDSFVNRIGTASILHDVGKITTPDRILLKPGPLDEDEFTIIRRHTSAGAKLLQQAHRLLGNSDYLQMGIEIALCHHERHDGKGYPAGLQGEAIPLAARICAIADVFDALTSRRTYKRAWSRQEALNHILEQRGKQFDPLVVDAFITTLEARARTNVVEWTAEMSVGNTHIDEQHIILIDIINHLASANAHNDRPVVGMIIDELVSYAAFHFQFEEHLMESIDFPEVAAHRRIHEKFVERIARMRDDFTFRRSEDSGTQLLAFLSHWLRQHILIEDQRYSALIDDPHD
jgi:hemerythrin-like metal-binding protein